jgi:hypothetical protein
VAAAAVLAGLLGGCATTQQTSARAKLQAQRVLASRQALLVTRPDRDVRVVGAWLMRRGGRRAVAVLLRNAGPRALTDLPISVGLRKPGARPRYLNAAAGLPYFDNHVPAVPAGGEVTWVFTTSRPVRAGGAPFAVVGSPGSPPATTMARLPAIRALATQQPVPAGPATVTARVSNPSDVPQSDLELYAYAWRAGRYVAAGRATVRSLGPGRTATVKVNLVGSPLGAPVQFVVPPTIFE